MFFHGFADELTKTAFSAKEIPLYLLFLGALGAGQLATHYGIQKGMEGLESISPRLSGAAQGGAAGLALQALARRGRVTKGPAAIGALAGIAKPEILEAWKKVTSG